MKRIIVTLLHLTLSLHFVLAQNTQAEIDKMMKQAQEQIKKYSGDSTLSKIMKGIQSQQKAGQRCHKE